MNHLHDIKQKIFETAAAHLIRQNRKAVNADNQCKYRTDSGDMCAIGCLIDEKYYSSSFEGRLACTTGVMSAVARSQGFLACDVNPDFLWHLQRIHDRIEPENWYRELQHFARQHDLKMPEVQPNESSTV